MRFRFSLVAIVIAVSGCLSGSQVFEVAPGIFTVTSTGDAYVSADQVRTSVLMKGTEFCNRRGELFGLIREDRSMTRLGIDTTISLNFICYPKSGPRPFSGNGIAAPIEKTPSVDGAVLPDI